MYTVGLDVHQRVSVLCVLDSAGKLVKQERLPGDVNVLLAYLRKLRSPFQICYEASSGSERADLVVVSWGVNP